MTLELKERIEKVLNIQEKTSCKNYRCMPIATERGIELVLPKDILESGFEALAIFDMMVFYPEAPEMASIIRELQAVVEERDKELAAQVRTIHRLNEDIEFTYKWVERGLFQKNTSTENALKTLFYYPRAPWRLPKEWTWDVSHKEYAKEFKEALNQPKEE